VKNYTYNELEYAKLICNNGFQTNHIPTELRLLVLYYRDVLNFDSKKRKEELEKFCETHLSGFNLAKDYVLFDKALRRGGEKKQKLITIPSIPITIAEFSYLRELDIPITHKKVMFAFLVNNKLRKRSYEIRNGKCLDSKFFKGGRKEYGCIRKMSNIPNNIKINDDVIHNLSNSGLIVPTYPGVVELKFLDYIIDCDEVMFYVENYDCAGYYFDYYCGTKRIKLCKECKSPFYSRSNSQEYCKDHTPSYSPAEPKHIICIDCGKDFVVNGVVKNKKRCDECQLNENKRIKREHWKKIQIN